LAGAGMTEEGKMNFNQKVYEIAKKVPKGKVTTYGTIAAKLGNPRWSRQVGWPRTVLTSSRDLRPRLGGAHMRGKALYARAVGNALHQNTDPNVPCHRVVDRTGRVAPNFGGPDFDAFSARGGPAFGWDGAKEQRRRLEVEGVKFRDEMHVNLNISGLK